MKKKIAILIAARNEELVIKKTLEKISKIVDKNNIFLISDNSTDKTAEIAFEVLPKKNVIINKQKMGKSNSLNSAIEKFKITENYKIVMPVDADTIVTKEVISSGLEAFELDAEIVAVVGRIKSDGKNYISYYRNWEYEIGHTILKKAQSYINAITVCSGCATLYKTEVFKQLVFVDDTVTEDTDLTFTIHRKKLGKIVFVDSGAVHTQDPNNLKALTKQLVRWYSGFWQNVVKHNVPWEGQILDLEVALLALGGISNGILTIAGIAFLFSGIFNVSVWTFFLQQIAIDIALLMIPTVAYTAYKNNLWKMFLYLPGIYLIRIYSVLIFMYCFMKVMLGKEAAQWDRTQRYKYNDNKTVILSE